MDIENVNDIPVTQERKEKLIRILQILQSTDSKSPMNAKQIIDRLDRDFNVGKVERRGIYKDIVMLQSCGYPIEKCKSANKGWYYGKRIFEEWELKIMMDAVSNTRFITTEKSKIIKEKMLELVSERSRQKFAHIMDMTSADEKKDEKTGEQLAILLDALSEKKKISFNYTVLDSKLNVQLKRDGHEYILNPYTLYWSNNTYYVIGTHDHHHTDATFYRLDRMRNLKILDENIIDAVEAFGTNPELKLREYVQRSVNNYHGETIKVTVKYEPTESMNNIMYDFAGRDVSIISTKDSKVKATFKMSDSPTLVNWLCQYADKVEVLKPEKIREKVIQKLRDGLSTYNEL